MRSPPTRYKVVERGRRLVVIDTRTGAPVGEHGNAGSPPPAQPVRRAPAGVDDGSVFTTRNWYDEKAPRTVRLNYAARQRIKNVRFAIALATAAFVVLLFLFWPFSLVLFALPLVQPKLHSQARGAITRWIDDFDQAA